MINGIELFWWDYLLPVHYELLCSLGHLRAVPSNVVGCCTVPAYMAKEALLLCSPTGDLKVMFKTCLVLPLRLTGFFLRLSLRLIKPHLSL